MVRLKTGWALRLASICAACASCEGSSEHARPDAEGGSGANETTVILRLHPEDMTFESDPSFDGLGVLAVDLFDTPHPFGDAGGPRSLYHLRIPPSAPAGAEVALGALPEVRITLTDAPSTLYFRVTFLDTPGGSGTALVPGTWVGGVDFSAGLGEALPLVPVSIVPGAVQAVSVNLVAMRGLSVTVTASATPIGDGEGPLVIVVTDDPDGTHRAPVLGLGGLSCASVADMPLTIVVPLVAPAGTYYVTGFLNDLGIDSELAPGELAAMDIDVERGTGVIPATLELPRGDYTPAATIDLSFTLPPPDDGVILPNSCADIAASAGDAAGL